MLHQLHRRRPTGELVEVIEKFISVLSDLEEPLTHLFLFDFRFGMAPATAVVLDLLVGKHRLAFRTPVNRRFFAHSKTFLVELQEQPLRPLVIIGITCGDFPTPIVACSELLELLVTHVFDVALRPSIRVLLMLNRRILSRQAERVPSHRVENVVTLHPALARDDIRDRVNPHVTHVQVARRIREHDKRVILRLRAIVVSLIDFDFFPALLPFLFEILRVELTYHELKDLVVCACGAGPVLRALHPPGTSRFPGLRVPSKARVHAVTVPALQPQDRNHKS